MLTVAIALVATPALAQPARGGGFAVRTLSARPDMVSGGDVLIEITAPSWSMSMSLAFTSSTTNRPITTLLFGSLTAVTE